ncbi:MAG TPA: hypothetical protein VFR37_10935 [Longimicrobium sp.]|nr:hypothetical protein [Longimicrobium sp.]
MDARRLSRVAALGAAALLLGAAPAAAQRVVAGFARINQSDVTGPAVTSGDLLNFEFGTAQSVSCAAAWGIRTEGRALDAELQSLVLTPLDPADRVLWEGAQRDLARLLAGGPGTRAARRNVREALAPATNRGARGAAGRLVQRLEGLLGAVLRMDPADPGRGAPTRLYAAVGAWDDYIDASGAAFLADPPNDLLAVQAVLGRLVRAAIEHSARDGDTEVVDAWGLACAPLAVAQALPPPPMPPPVVEEAFEVCVLDGGDFRRVTGVWTPATGDSLVQVGASRRPLAWAYPDRFGYAADASWFGRDRPLVVAGYEYQQWGTPRLARPGEFERRGQYLGVTVFADPDGPFLPDVIYLPSRSPCEVQPYRRTIETHRVRG